MRHFIKRYAMLPCVSLAAISISISSAQAQDNAASTPTPVSSVDQAGAATLQDIVVTAEKRNTNIQKTPISITALNGDALQAAQIRNLTEVKSLVPAMQMGENDGYAQITIRGIGISSIVPAADSAVALNVNEVYVSRPIAQLTGLYDVGSLEALRGPQGTLYGRNATAGSINIATRRPTDTWSGYGRVTVGNYAAVNVEAAVGGPIIDDVLLVRVAGFIDKHDGFGTNIVTGNPVSDKNARGIRGTLVFNPTSSLKATIIADYYKERDNGAALHYFGPAGLINLPGNIGVPPVFVSQGGYTTTDLQDTAAGRDSKFELRTTSVTGILEWSRGAFGIKSITGYRDQNSRTLTPLDGGSTDNAFYLAGEPAHQFSEELQFHYDQGRLHLTAGLYYFKEKDASAPGVSPFKASLLAQFFGVPYTGPDYFVDFVEIGGTIRTTAKAAFGQATYEILDGLSLTAGIRYSDERKEAENNFAFNLTQPWTPSTPQPPAIVQTPQSFKSTTPKVGIQYQIDPRTMIYASYSKGFKSGGFDVTTPAPAFRPEKVTDYEGGLKTTLFDNRLRLGISGFYYDYTDLQVLQVIGTQVITANAGAARIYGGEIEFTALPTPELQLDGAVSLLHARYRSYIGPSSVQVLLPTVDFSGHRLNNAPDFSGHAGATYTWELGRGSVALRGEAEFASRFYFTPDNVDMLSQHGFVKGNAFLTYTSSQGWHATAFVRNISDIDTKVSGNVNTPVLGSPARGAVAPPRTFGLELGYKF